MDRERLSKIEQIYHSTLDISIGERPDFLSANCGDDQELRREVENLLSFAEVSSSLIDQPPGDVAAELIAETTNSALIGTNIKHYKIVSQIGTGGMGEVFKAFDTKLERSVAIKFIKTEFVEDKDKLRRFKQEAKNASSLNHPNILTVYEIGHFKKRQFIAAEFIEGKTLRKSMKEGSLALYEILEVALQTATALIAAHSAGIIHRDIKPENIMLREDGLVKVLDFGLAKLSQVPIGKERESEERNSHSAIHNPKLTNPSSMMGTVAYMSPEQARFEPVDRRSDLWSLGVVLHEMVAGSQPFAGRTTSETIDSILNNEPASLVDNFPYELKRILLKGLKKNAEDRYQTAEDLLDDLKNCQKDAAVESGFGKKFAKSRGNGITSNNKTRVSNSVRLRTNEDLEVESKNLSGFESIFKKAGTNWVVSIGLLAIILFAITYAGYDYFIGSSQPVNSIAVMVFENGSGDPDMEYLSDGITNSLINSISQLNGVKLISQSSAFKYKGKEAEFKKNVRDLGGQFVLRGQISQSGNDLLLSAELVNIIDNARVWGEDFHRKSSQLSNIETEISQRIVDRLQIYLSGNAKQQLVRTMTRNPRAYELYIKGRFSQSKNSFESSKNAVAYFNQALAVDPDYAEAYAALARTHFFLGANGFHDPKEAMPKAKAAAVKAVELDDSLAAAHLAMAVINAADWDWSGAEREYKRAIELHPNLAEAHFRYALYLSTMGRHENAIAEMNKSRELDPLNPDSYLEIGYILYFARQYDSALEQAKTKIELDPNNGSAYNGKAFVHAAKKEYDYAIANYKERIRLAGEHTGVDCYLGFALAKAGRLDEARAILKKLVTGKDYVSPVELAMLYVGLGDRDKAFSALNRGYAEHDSQMQYLLIEPHFDGLRADPRFAVLIRKVGLPQ